MKLLLVEDDVSLAEALAEALTDQRYVIDVVVDGEAAWLQIKISEYDLILLDMMLPHLDGIELCRRLRNHGYTIPVLMLTARDTIKDKVNGLDAGADDYLVKPVDLQELLARIRALLRRGNSSLPPILAWDGLQLDPSTYEVTYNNQPIHLSPKEYSLLELFLRHPRRLMTRNFIITHLWSLEKPPKEETVKAHVKSLRNKLKSVTGDREIIETVYGIGYRLKLLFDD